MALDSKIRLYIGHSLQIKQYQGLTFDENLRIDLHLDARHITLVRVKVDSRRDSAGLLREPLLVKNVFISSFKHLKLLF